MRTDFPESCLRRSQTCTGTRTHKNVLASGMDQTTRPQAGITQCPPQDLSGGRLRDRFDETHFADPLVWGDSRRDVVDDVFGTQWRASTADDKGAWSLIASLADWDTDDRRVEDVLMLEQQPFELSRRDLIALVLDQL